MCLRVHFSRPLHISTVEIQPECIQVVVGSQACVTVCPIDLVLDQGPSQTMLARHTRTCTTRQGRRVRDCDGMSGAEDTADMQL